MNESKDKKVTVSEFIRIYEETLKSFFNEMDDPEIDEPESHIYGYPFEIHWNGIYCNVGDGATPANHLIPALNDMLDELDDAD